MAKIVRTRKRWIWLIKGPMAIVLIVGLAAVAFQFFVAGVDFFPTDMELPLGDLVGVSVGGDNLILCGSGAYHRIQVYSSNGDFIRAIDIHGKLFEFYVNRQGTISVSSAGYLQNYSLDGEFLWETRKNQKTLQKFYNSTKSAFMDEEGNTYSVAPHSWLFPRILRTTPDGQSSTVVSQPWYLWLIQDPFPSAFYICLGMGTLVICYLPTELRKIRQRRKTPDSSPSSGNDPTD